MNAKLVSLIAISIITAGCNNHSGVARRISVSGSATKEVNADRIEMHVQIDNDGKNNMEAVSTNAKYVSELISMLGDYKTSISNIQKSVATFGAKNDYEKKREVYNAETGITFLIMDPSIFDSLSLKISKIPGASVSASKFALSNEIELRANVRDTAIQKAKEKAARMANTLGLKLGKPIEVSEGNIVPSHV